MQNKQTLKTAKKEEAPVGKEEAPVGKEASAYPQYSSAKIRMVNPFTKQEFLPDTPTITVVDNWVKCQVEAGLLTLVE